MALVGRPLGFGSDPPIGSGQVRGSPQVLLGSRDSAL